MSTVKICDRCKNVIKDDCSRAVFKPVFISSWLNYMTYRDGIFGKRIFKDRSSDLCEECSNKLLRFLDGAELELDVDVESGEESEDT